MTAPIACSLSTEDYLRRAGDIREIARGALLRTRPVGGGVQLTHAEVFGRS